MLIQVVRVSATCSEGICYPVASLHRCRYCQARYAKGVEYGVPLDVANKAPPAQVPALAYIPPPLQDRSWGWYPEWQKIWEGWGTSTCALLQ